MSRSQLPGLARTGCAPERHRRAGGLVAKFDDAIYIFGHARYVFVKTDAAG